VDWCDEPCPRDDASACSPYLCCPSRKPSLVIGEMKGWSREFDEPIPRPNGKSLVTLSDARAYILKLTDNGSRLGSS
jgi:hypothetical protein